MRRILPASLLAAAVLAAAIPQASAGDCQRSRGRVVQGRRSHAQAAPQSSWSGRTVVSTPPTTGHVVHPAPVQSVTERIVSGPVVTTAPAVKPLPDIVDTAVGAGSFKTLAAALGAADLVGTLKGDGPFTVFAPTDDAFAKLPAGTVEDLLKPENKDKLRDILLLHVVPGKVAAKDVVALKEAKTAGGGTLAIDTTDGVKVGTASGTAKVVKTDIPAKNGLIHVIDSVILP